MDAEVRMFNGKLVTFTVTKVWFYNGVPDRLYCRDDKGNAYKFKMDEQQFTLGTGTLVAETH